LRRDRAANHRNVGVVLLGALAKRVVPLPLARSMPWLRPCTFDQSVFPAVLGTRLPSPPSKVLGASDGEHD
jgi:hypothetical protein